MAQIIDEDAHIVDGLSHYLDSIGITHSGLDYHIVSIIGAQSSGKSTLLNRLFNTSFQTMNESTGRQQTTKGIHAAYSEQNKILIFDIEGSDSRERGDADALFERKAALFALSLSEVVMVNMWQHDIGRYQGSSIPLLKTVFEVNLQLFASESKCHLLFVIRDSTSEAEVIKSQVKRDLEGIWNSLTLPPHLAGRPFEDFFIFHFFALPHLRISKTEFDSEIVKLRNEFEDSKDEHFLFKQPTGKIIPGDGLYNYICGVWDAISENKELNLPSQRRTLSNFRCDEFAKNTLDQFEKSILNDITPQLQDGKVMPDFKEKCTSLIDHGIKQYNNDSRQYVQDIVESKRKELIGKMGELLASYYQLNIQNYYEEYQKSFKRYILKELPADLKNSTNWEQNATSQIETFTTDLHNHVANDVVKDFEWEYDTSNFQPKLQALLEARLTELISNLEDQIANEKLTHYKDSIDKDLNDAPPDMWAILRRKMKTSIKTTEGEVNEILANNTLGPRTCSKRIEERFYRATNSRVLLASRYVFQKMNLKFEEKFRQDEKGNTRDWQPDDDVSTIFETARDSGINVLKMFMQCQLREPNEPIPPNDLLTQQMINPITSQGLEDKFNDQIEKIYIDAVRIKESKRIRFNIPYWMIGLYIYFGYPKLIFFIRHPIYMLFFITFLLFVYWLYKKGHLKVIIEKVIDTSLLILSKGMELVGMKKNLIPRPKARKVKKGSRKRTGTNIPGSHNSLQPNALIEDVSNKESPVQTRHVVLSESAQQLSIDTPIQSNSPEKKEPNTHGNIPVPAGKGAKKSGDKTVHKVKKRKVNQLNMTLMPKDVVKIKRSFSKPNDL